MAKRGRKPFCPEADGLGYLRKCNCGGSCTPLYYKDAEKYGSCIRREDPALSRRVIGIMAHVQLVAGARAI